MPESVTVASGSNAASSFFSRVWESFETGVSRIASDVLPNWVATELGAQSSDQLKQETFNQEAAPSRLYTPIQTGRDVPEADRPFTQKTFLDIGAFQVTGGTPMIAGALFIGILLIFRKGG